MKKNVGACFLCEMPGKVRPFTFYSGVMKGGTTHRMLSCTVTFFERWSDLTLHEIQVCRSCQVRLWRQKHLLPMILFGSGTVVAVLFGLLTLLLLDGKAQFIVPAVAALGAVGLGAF